MNKWDGKAPKEWHSPLRDGDDKESGGAEYQNVYYLNATNYDRPCIIDANKDEIFNVKEEIYSGVWANVSINFYAYKFMSNKGVGCGINGVQKAKDGDRFSGAGGSAADFDGFDSEEDDEL